MLSLSLPTAEFCVNLTVPIFLPVSVYAIQITSFPVFLGCAFNAQGLAFGSSSRRSSFAATAIFVQKHTFTPFLIKSCFTSKMHTFYVNFFV
jgi:hypothetical protein